MRPTHFDAMGLKPARYATAEITRRFFARRAALLAALDDSTGAADVQRELDELHVAYLVLRDADAQAAYLRECAEGGDRVARLRRLIAASLEGGLLRCSRRERILDEARRLGLSEFHAHLLIAQTQFGDQRTLLAPPAGGGFPAGESNVHGRAAARLAAAVILALALLLAAIRYVHG